jgi:hypothetical protein
MKNIILIAFLSTLMILSCNKEDLPDTFKIGSQEEFQHGEMNQSDDNSLKFSITEINDSRCPSDVVCVWEGKVDVKILVESPQSGTIILSTYDNLKDTVGNFSFELIEVLPYPISTQTIKLEDYDVTLKIEELQN